MPRFLRTLAVVACGVTCSTAATSSARPPTGSATVIGDSVSALIEQVPAAAYALRNGLAVSADLAVCRRLVAPSCDYKGTQPTTALEQIQSLTRTPRVVVLDVGYNDNADTFAQDAATVMAALVKRGVAHVVWVTLREERSSYADSNNAIRALATRWPSVIRIADWNAASAGQPWFEPDGLHLNSLGAVMLAQLIHSNLVAACKGGCSLPSRPRGFRLTVTPNIDACGDENGGWKAVFGHTATLPAAKLLLDRIRAVGFRDGSGIQSTGASDQEVVVGGIQSTKQLTGFANEALKAGFIVSFKPD